MLPSAAWASSAAQRCAPKIIKATDPAKRDFKDKDEWKATLKVLQEAGKLTYDAVSDNISLPV